MQQATQIVETGCYNLSTYGFGNPRIKMHCFENCQFYTRRLFMRSFFRTLGVITFLYTAGLQGYVTEDCHFDHKSMMQIDDRLYLHPSLIYISQNSIYINFYNQLLPVNSIHSDANGIYVEADTIRSLYWTCKNEHVNYYTDYPKCIFCGAGPKPK